jgi:hypothetical protein
VNLFVPGQTKLTPQDVFLGGTGTGVADSALNGAIRVFGNDRAKTAQALTNYHQDLSSQIRSAQATNAAPRVDSAMGVPTMSRLAMENSQAQNSVSNNLARDTYNHGVAQDNFTNQYNVGGLMGTYGGAPTLAQKAQTIQNAQNGAGLAQSASQFDRTLASNDYNSAANRIIDQQNANTNGEKANNPTPNQSDIVSAATGQAQDYLNAWASGTARDDNGNLKPRATSDEIQQWVKDNSGELTANKVNVSTFGKWAANTFTWNP